MRAAVAFAAACVLAASCVDESIVPVPGSSEPQAPPAPTDPPPDPPVQKKREILQRDPFGNVAEAQNLLWDGDFEWISPFGDQYGWIEPPASPTVSNVVVGPDCRSGIKCARLPKNGDLVGIAVSSSQFDLEASVWVRFLADASQPAPACSEAEAYLLDLLGLEAPDEDAALQPTSELPDESGWCRLHAVAPKRTNKTYFYVENRSDFPMLVDDAVLKPTGGEIPIAKPGPAKAIDPGSRARARDAALATRRPMDGAPSPVRDGLRRWKGPR